MSSSRWNTTGQRVLGSKVTPAKRPASTLSGATAKRPAPPANGLLQGHASHASPASTATTAASTSTAANEAPPESQRTPAIYLDSTPEWPVHAAALEKKLGKPLEAVFRGSQFRLTTTSVEDFRLVQRYCLSKRLSFYTHGFKGMKPLKVVISGLPDFVSPESLYDHLVDDHFPVRDTRKLMAGRRTTKCWLVELASDRDMDRDEMMTKRGAEIYNLTHLFHVRVAVRPFRRPLGPAQCHRCQGFGHGSFNCGRPAKCVRCGGPHRRNECSLPAEERGPCCNCGGPHQANYRGCPEFQRRKPRYTKHPPRRPKPAPVPDPPEDQPEGPEEKEDADGFTPVRRKKKRGRGRNKPPPEPLPAEESPAPPAKVPAPQPSRQPKVQRKEPLERSPSASQEAGPAKPADNTSGSAETPAPACRSELAATLAEVLRQLSILTSTLAQLLPTLQ